MALISTSVNTLSNVVKHEYGSDYAYTRDAITVNDTAGTIAVGTVLGKYITGGTAAAVADAGNTGNGVMGTITVTAPAKVGEYRLVFVAAATNAGTFVVTDPDGRTVGAGTVAVAFSKGGLAFTLADGATDFAVGDAFTIAVAGTYKYKRAVQTATDGTAVAAAVVWEAKTILGTTDTTMVAVTRGPAGVSKTGLVLDASYDTAAEKTIVYAALAAKGIQVLETI